MSIWIDSNNQLHDDMDGEALTLPIWPKGMTIATQAQIDAQLAAYTVAIENAAPDPIAVLQQQVADLQAQLAAVAASNPSISAAMAAVKV